MDTNLIMNTSGWDYANLAKSAAEHGGPQKFVDAIYDAGRAADVANAKLLGTKVGITVGVTVGVIVGVTVGKVVYAEALKQLSSKREEKNEELILQQEIDNDENLEETGADL